jgi:hypothetical protein
LNDNSHAGISKENKGANVENCRPAILKSNSGNVKIIVIIVLLAAASWYWNYYKPSVAKNSNTTTEQTPAPATPQASTAEKLEPSYDSAQDYAKKKVSFAGVTAGQLDRPGLILRFNNSGNKDISNLSVQIIGYKQFYVQDMSKAEGTEYVVDLEVKSFPANKVTESVLYFPSGVQSINPKIVVYNASY